LTANLAQIKEAQALGVLDGVTTTIIDGKEELPENSILKHYVDICNLVDGDVSAEKALDYDGMIKEGEELADLHDQIVVKLPMTKEGVMAEIFF
jgi:transaldolase